MASTAAAATIDSLPEELLEKIARHIEYPLERYKSEDQRPTLRSFSLVCKNWLKVSRRVARAVNVLSAQFQIDSGERLVQTLSKFEVVDDLRLCCEQRGFRGRVAPALSEHYKNLRALRITFHSHLPHATQWKFPSCLGSLAALRSLHARNVENLARLPATVGQWRNLAVLCLRGCTRLRSLPSEASEWTSLTHLDLAFCKELERLPAGSKSWSLLETLTLSSCRALQELLEHVGVWTRLRECCVNRCVLLRTIPDGVSKWQHLVNFNAAGCQQLRSLGNGLIGWVRLEAIT
jgi:hypothetical protein